MIKDKLSNAEIYYNISEKLRKGFEWIKEQDFKNMPDGKYELSDGIYANLQSYQTKEDALYEAEE